MEEVEGTGADPNRHVVVLVHGIRTRAKWYVEVQGALKAAGFEVRLSNYGRFDFFKFLLPGPFFLRRAADHVEEDIRAAMADYKVDRVSVIAHSFGTYVIGWILKNKEIAFKKIIFCGSILKFRFPFQSFSTRFESITNEVGTRDIWPILAESATWSYGSTGAFGFYRSPVFDRFHKGLSHSRFLNAAFCQKWWIPVLRGHKPSNADSPEDPPWWLQFLSVVHIKYLFAVLIAFIVWASTPDNRKFMLAHIGMVCLPSGSTAPKVVNESSPASQNGGGTNLTATELLVVISSLGVSYKRDIEEFLHDASQMKRYAADESIKFVEKLPKDPFFNVIEEYKSKDPKGTTDLDDPDEWIAYSVRMFGRYSKIPIPTEYAHKHRTRFFVILAGQRARGQEAEQSELDAAVTGMPANRSPQLALMSEMTPNTSPDLTNLNVWIVRDENCWK
jgi:pimeloyl-ACP methyl ester carboxylesterase